MTPEQKTELDKAYASNDAEEFKRLCRQRELEIEFEGVLKELKHTLSHYAAAHSEHNFSDIPDLTAAERAKYRKLMDSFFAERRKMATENLYEAAKSFVSTYDALKEINGGKYERTQ